jgi:hypothetical protein
VALAGGAVVGVRWIALLEQDDPPCRTRAAAVASMATARPGTLEAHRQQIPAWLDDEG